MSMFVFNKITVYTSFFYYGRWSFPHRAKFVLSITTTISVIVNTITICIQSNRRSFFVITFVSLRYVGRKIHICFSLYLYKLFSKIVHILNWITNRFIRGQGPYYDWQGWLATIQHSERREFCNRMIWDIICKSSMKD